MSGYLNKVTLIGNLGQDPEIRVTQNGTRVVTLSIATSESWKDQSGERRERTEWHRVVIFNEGLGKTVEKYLTKGAKVYVEGALRTRKWTDQAGVDRYSTEIQLSPFNGQVLFMSDTRRNGQHAAGDSGAATASAGASGGIGGGAIDHDIPYAACWQ
jgi:single-strand DNA-binding protein